MIDPTKRNEPLAGGSDRESENRHPDDTRSAVASQAPLVVSVVPSIGRVPVSLRLVHGRGSLMPPPPVLPPLRPGYVDLRPRLNAHARRWHVFTFLNCLIHANPDGPDAKETWAWAHWCGVADDVYEFLRDEFNFRADCQRATFRVIRGGRAA